MVVASLYYKDAKTSGPYKTDIVATTLPGMETTTLSLPETSRRYSPRSNSEWIVWEERYSGSFGKIVLYNTKNRTMIDPVHIGGSLHNPKIGNNHFIATEYDEVLGVSKLRLFSFTAEEQYSPGGDAAEEGDSKNAAATVFNGYHLPDGMLIILIGIIAGVMAVAVLLKRENR
ncbi:hypothetical protein MKMG_02107 [Methanogenium sp. MK-MG]|nr:hypothetical protein MKMG_02107 [Methanogenium sp. MK-MG]